MKIPPYNPIHISGKNIPRDIVIRKNKFHDHRARAILVQGENINISNNIIERISMNGILIETDVTLWYEDAGATNMVIENNKFFGVNAMPTEGKGAGIIHFFTKAQSTSPNNIAQLSSKILLRNNIFELNMSEGPILQSNLKIPESIAFDKNIIQIRRIADNTKHDIICPGHRFGFGEEGTFYAYTNNFDPQNLIGLYNCQQRNFDDRFVSIHPNCEGHNVLGFIGFVWKNTESQRNPIYRCIVNNQYHMVSKDSLCEGTKVEGILGYSVK